MYIRNSHHPYVHDNMPDPDPDKVYGLHLRVPGYLMRFAAVSLISFALLNPVFPAAEIVFPNLSKKAIFKTPFCVRSLRYCRFNQ